MACGAHGWLGARLGARTARYRDELGFLRSRLDPRLVVAGEALLLGAAAMAAPASLPLSGALLLPLALLRLGLTRARRARISRLDAQVEAWLGAVGRALEAAPSLGEALASSAQVTDAPLAEELEQLLGELRLGTPLDRALSALGVRVGSRSLDLALATLRVGRSTGGRLPEVLRSAAASLRELTRLEGVLRTKTAEGRTQALVISLVPLPLYVGVRAMDPTYFTPLETTPIGKVILAGSVCLWLLAGFLARRVLAVDL